MYGSVKDVRHNLFLFVVDGIVYMPAMTLISITTIIPYFLEQLGASTFHIAIAVAMTFICSFISQPFFGSIASRSHKLHITNGKILLLQRTVFLAFILCIPLLVRSQNLLIWTFLAFWGLFNLFVGSYNIFYTSLLLKILPPDKRGAIRGMGFAIGAALGVGVAALIPVLLSSFSFPYNYMLIFIIGSVLLIIDGILFFFMREFDESEPRIPMSVGEYFKEMPSTVRDNPAFRTMIITCTFLVIANSLLSYYTLYAIRIFHASETDLATLSALAVISVSVGYVAFGFILDRKGPKTTSIIAACLIITAGFLALTTRSLSFLFIAWIFANLGSTCSGVTITLLLGDVSPPSKVPLHVGVYTVISLAISSAVVLIFGPVLEYFGFTILFASVLVCGALSLLINIFVLRKYLLQNNIHKIN